MLKTLNYGLDLVSPLYCINLMMTHAKTTDLERKW